MQSATGVEDKRESDAFHNTLGSFWGGLRPVWDSVGDHVKTYFLNRPTFPAALPHGGRGGKQPGRPMTDSGINSFDKPTADTKI